MPNPFNELTLPATIGNRIKQVRNFRGMFQSEVAEACGCTCGYISQIEAGDRIPTLHTLSLIANALGCELDINFVPRKD